MANVTRSEPRIEAIQDIYQLAYMMEEVRVSYKKDAKMSVGNIAIDAKEGDMSSLQRWVARILVNQGAVEIQSNDITGYISRTINRERIAKPHDLSGVDIDFYVRVNEYLEGLRERERENLIVSLNTFVASRLEKIVKLAAASPLSAELESKLTAEEKELYILINNVSTKFKREVLKKFG
jgi:DNA replication factor GINS